MNSLLPPALARNGAEDEPLRDVALALLRAPRGALVHDFQQAALRVAIPVGTVTADDVRHLVPIPAVVSPKCVGAAFRELANAGIFWRVGFGNSKRAVAHARPRSVWELRDAAVAAAWHAAHPETPAA